ncbi:MAG: amidophosphoribosyltransferase [Planctomycetota bacterium]
MAQLSQPGVHNGDNPRHHCGIIGIFGVSDAARHVYSGLYALQHRGQESAGIVASDGEHIQSKKGLGLLPEAVPQEGLSDLPGHIAIGHVRYSTTGAKRVQNIQPLVVEYSQGIVAIAHNGNLTNARSLREMYEAKGSIFQTATDSEIVVHLLADPEHIGVSDPLGESLQHVSGAFSLLMMTSNRLMAARDPHGFRPLSVAQLGDGYVVASETCAFDLLGAKYERDIEPGEILSVDQTGVNTWRYAADRQRKAHCLFEQIYFARPDSYVFGDTVHNVRAKLGENLAKDSPVEADAVISVPHSGDPAALGYARASGLPLDTGFICNRYIGRTFIKPPEEDRERSVEIKLNVIADVVRGKRLVVVDDSIVRGTTCKTRLNMLREAGAEELHMRISAPPIRYPCYYGIDFPDKQQLIAANKSVDEIREFLNVDSFAYQTVDGLLDAVSGEPSEYCLGCFTGDQPVTVEENMDRLALEHS